MSSFAIYRLPHEDHATLIRQTSGEPEELLSCTALNGRQGFVMAPFEVTPCALTMPSTSPISIRSSRPDCFVRSCSPAASMKNCRRG